MALAAQLVIYAIGLLGSRNSLFLNEAKNARKVLYLMSLATPGRAFLSSLTAEFRINVTDLVG
jgi:hypothetical protein